MATKKKKKKIGFAAQDDNKKDAVAVPFQHTHKKTAHALEHAKMVQKGKKFWEEKEAYEHVSDVEWWQLKAAKDFETGIGQTFFHQGTLSTWTDQQIVSLQQEMQQTLQLAGYNDDDTEHVRLKTPDHEIMPGQKADANMGDFAAEIQRQQAKQKQTETQKAAQEEDEHPLSLYEFDDEIIHTGNSDEEDSDEKRSKYIGDSMIEFDIKQLTSMDELAGTFDAKPRGSHKRTRTEALRVKLQNMQSELDSVTEISGRQSVMLDKRKENEQKSQVLQSKLSGLSGALQSANDELDRAEEQIVEKDEEVANLQRELAISKQMNRELAQTALDVNTRKSTPTVTSTGLTADDLLKQRMKDANRFAFMLSAMQEQLDFERKQFVKKIHNLELQLEHKDVQLNALYQLYNKLVEQTQTAQQSWWQRLTTK